MRISKGFQRVRGKKWTIAAACAVGLFLAGLSLVPKAVMTATTQRDLPIYCVQKDSKVCSLTFDAAWGNEDTQQLIDILGKYKVKATFFVVGEWVDKFPESVKALHDAGHEIMNHSDDHAHFTKLSVNFAFCKHNKSLIVCQMWVAPPCSITHSFFTLRSRGQ